MNDDSGGGAAPILRLEDFLPYRLSVLSNRVSAAIAQDYAERFDMTVPEWRTMAALGEHPGLSAAEVATFTEMDKVAVSRAVARMIEMGRLTRTTSPDDRRRSVLKLSAAGQRIYRQIVPVARAHEANLVGPLSTEERRQLDKLLAKLFAAATADLSRAKR
ncbi:MAG TPA: MarR family winged helix-turn-helix transcriptional regulator [Hypericibacter adhaerens]|jgi:DNA-binding MarR family transcriptional regulator|uniref:MarR family transcriptional regulator n=1 Tax=Hypericibacter adhaerens TaxID=2602016 RepID=A0A5J6N331_9PROT|nr:MarR family winged helix-turn-helix transcriptional regulator [Hypericibacter adhaerens]QEX21356.1 MarR family transcriptional regulator [Hypericibacter adhaerens]HWA42969.1 MarR family winged helix-turn-helix transcriptional regulator [Hypericibacter adhaerens]